MFTLQVWCACRDGWSQESVHLPDGAGVEVPVQYAAPAQRDGGGARQGVDVPNQSSYRSQTTREWGRFFGIGLLELSDVPTYLVYVIGKYWTTVWAIQIKNFNTLNFITFHDLPDLWYFYRL